MCSPLFQSIDFVGHHVRRTTATVVLHLLLPLVYCMGLGLVEPEWSMVCEGGLVGEREDGVREDRREEGRGGVCMNVHVTVAC